MTRLLIGITLAVLMGYGLWEAHPLLAGPSLSIALPKNGGAYADGVVAIEGSASRAVALTLDGSPVLPDRSGRFALTLAFPTGGSIITMRATDRFGRSVTKERAIYVP